MNDFKLVDTETGNEKFFDSRAEAEDQRDDLPAPNDRYEIVAVSGSESAPADEDGERGASAVEEQTNVAAVDTEPVKEVPESSPSITEDPVDWMPSHFVDTIQGMPTVNRKGYAVIASKHGISVTAEPVTRASETDFEHAEFRATATTPDGQEYSGFGSAHVDRDDGDDEHLLNELAETRAMKRAVAWASGVGMTAIEEMQGEL